MKNRIAVVEDDRLIRDMILLKLKKAGYAATGFDSAEAFLMEGTEKSHDVIILDFFLPGMSGEKMLGRLRSRPDNTPVLILTVKEDIPSRIQLLNSGADDYMIKPFNMGELLARVKALIRRSQGKRRIPANRILVINGIKVNTETRICESREGTASLSDLETRLLLFLTTHASEALSRADILEEVWGMDVAPTPRTVDNFILKFRKLFEDNPERPRHFMTVRNKGYRFDF